MNRSALTLLGYSAWTLALLGGIALLRGTLTVTRQRAANGFAVAGDDVSPFSGRLCRAHANCYESLPAAASIILIAMVTGNAMITDVLGPWLLAARVAQSVTHLSSTSVRAVQVRFSFFLAQFVIQVIWIAQLLPRVVT